MSEISLSYIIILYNLLSRADNFEMREKSENFSNKNFSLYIISAIAEI